MKSTFFTFIIIGLLFFSCGKSTDPNVINVSLENAFYSAELGDVIGTHPASTQAVFDLVDHGYEHYLVLNRNKDISLSDDWFSKFVYGATSLKDIGVSLDLNETELISAGENYVSYNFSNDFEFIEINGVVTDKLPQNSFDKVPFEFILGEITYQGNFPEPGSLKNDNTTPNIPLLYLDEVKTINWKPAQRGGGYIKMYINHHTTVNGPTRLPTKVITLDDTGSFDITPEVLKDYLKGDVISIRLSRDIFLKANKLLIRSVESQNWGPIELLEN